MNAIFRRVNWRKSILQAKWILVFLTMMSAGIGISQTITFSHQEQFSGNGNITVAADVGCQGYVKFKFISNRDIKNLRVHHNGGPVMFPGGDIFRESDGQQITNDEFAKDEWYSWTVHQTFVATSALIEFAFERNFEGTNNYENEGAALNYGHTAVTPPISIDYDVTEISPNNFSFTYTGTPIATGGISSYTYNLALGGGEGDINGSGAASPLIPNSLIGTASENPVFYCRAKSADVTVMTELSVRPMYALSGQVLECPVSVDEIITLRDLCTVFDGFEVSSIPPDEFSIEVEGSTSGNTILDGEVDSYSLTIDGNLIQNATLGGTTPYTFQTNVYANYPIEETIIIETGCVCQSSTQYNTADPCNNLSPITATQSFDNGMYVYTFSLSEYMGGASGNSISTITVDFGDGTTQTYSYPLGSTTISHGYQNDGVYTVTQYVTFNNSSEPCETTLSIGAETYCCLNFAPTPGDHYWLSAWVKEDHLTPQKAYESSFVELVFNTGAVVQLRPVGDIVEGWQRIIGAFIIPAGASEMLIDLVNTSGTVEAYFDDVRVHPFNASMKSYVYDPETLWLTAELDDNNYATFYEYDKEGQLIRIKKETARGIMTIQESRSSNPKK